MRILNKDRINILKLNIQDILFRFNSGWDTKSIEFILQAIYFMTDAKNVMACSEIKNR